MKWIKLLGVIGILMLIMGCSKPSIQLNDAPLIIKVGDKHAIEFLEGTSPDVVITSSNPLLAAITEDGRIEALMEGEVIIRVALKSHPDVYREIPVTIRKKITLTLEETQVQLIENTVKTVTASSNDSVTFTSSDPMIFVVDSLGKIEGKSPGIATLTVRSVYDPDVFITITVEVLKYVYIHLQETDLMLLMDERHRLNPDSSDDLLFESSNPLIASVDAEGWIRGVSIGEAIITMTSKSDASIFKSIRVSVFTQPSTIQILGFTRMNRQTDQQLSLDVNPYLGFPLVFWQSSDASLLSIDETGKVTAYQTGVVTITATSKVNSSVTASWTIEIVDQMMVSDHFINQNQWVDEAGILYLKDVHGFTNLTDALSKARPYTHLFLLGGEHQDDVVLDKKGLILTGSLATISGIWTLAADDVRISDLSFTNGAQIKNDQAIQGFVFNSNQVFEIRHEDPFIHLINVKSVVISHNTFHDLEGDGIQIKDYRGGDIVIHRNTMSELKTAISIVSLGKYDATTTLKVTRNVIDMVDTALEITNDHSEVTESILAYARFNAIKNYQIAAQSNANSNVDFTLNYWGTPIPDSDRFIEINQASYRGYYQSEAAIISEALYNPDLPLFIEIQNTVSEINIGDTHTFSVSFLPMEVQTDRLRWITSNPSVLMVSQNGTIEPLKSGMAVITVRLTQNSSIQTPITVKVLTDPGIELSFSKQENHIEVGDALTLIATPFPYSIANQAVFFESSHPSIASITQDGLIVTHQAGLVTFKVSLIEDPAVFNTFTIEVFDQLDPNNLLDLLTMYSLTYAKYMEWQQYGVSFDYIEKRYESVSRYHFGDLNINTSKLLPVFFAIRPGEPMDPHPAGITAFNPYNVYWVVMHETAGTNPGAGALSHANYLWNATINQNQLFVSWHFTVDHKEIYQHLPETERGFHAGDGSTRPGTSNTYLGGGNRNGIGIEMSVAHDEDMMTTLHRSSKLAADLLVRYQLPLSHMKYHQDFSGKTCPQGLIRSNMLPYLEKLAEIEYLIRKNHSDAAISFESHNASFLDQNGRIIDFPSRALTVSYTITVTEDGVTQSRTLYTYLPGTDV